ncbi:MAG: hypothetical protein ACLUQH_10850 [Collinsella sp.]
MARSVFGAWVDLRGQRHLRAFSRSTLEGHLRPRGVGPSRRWRTAPPTYLVDAHWSLELKKTYTFVNLADPELAIEWPIPLDEATVSEADLNHPMLRDVVPMAPKRTSSPAARPLCAWRWPRSAASPDFDFCDIDTFDIRPGRHSTTGRLRHRDQLRRHIAVDRAETLRAA